MARFIAHVEFEFAADDFADRGRRLRRLGAAVEPAGFELIRGEVRPAPERPDGPTGFGPQVESSDGEPSPARAASLAPPTAEGEREEPGLRRVLPVEYRFSDGTWIASGELWDHGLVIRWARPGRAPGRPVPIPGLIVSDDLGTSYVRRGGGASRDERGSLGHAEFEPAPPRAATSLQVRNEAAADVVSVPLTA